MKGPSSRGAGVPSRRASTLVQFVGNQALAALMIVQGIILVPLYLRHVGGDLYGQWLALGSTVAIFGLLDLGVTNLVVQRTAYFYGAFDFKSLGSLIGTSILFDLVVLALAGSAGFAFSPWASGWVGARGAEGIELASAFRIATLDLMLMFLVSMSGAILFGLQRPAAHMAGFFIGTIVSILLTVYLLSAGMGVRAIAYGSLVRPMIVLPVNSCALVRSLSKDLRWKMVRMERAMIKDFFRSALWLGPSKIAETLAPQVDNLVAVRMLRPVDVTILVLTRKATDVLILVAGRISASLFSGLSHLSAQGNGELYRKVVNTMFLSVLYLCAVGIGGIVLLNGDFVRIWTARELFGGQLLTVALCTYAAMKVLRITFYNVLLSMGEIRVASSSCMLEAAIEVAAGIVLCRRYGIVGIAFAGVLAAGAGFLVQANAYMKKTDMRPIALRTVVRVLSVAVLPLSAGFIVRAYWRPTGWVDFSLFSAGFLGLSLVIILFLEGEFRSYVRSKLPVVV